MLSTRQLITSLRGYLSMSAYSNQGDLADVAAVLVDVWYGVLDSVQAAHDLSAYLEVIRALELADVQLDGARLTITYSVRQLAFQLCWHDSTRGCVQATITIPYHPSTTSTAQIHAPHSQGTIGTAGIVEQNFGPITKLIQQGSALLNDAQLERIYAIVNQGTWDGALVEQIYMATPWFSLYNIELMIHPAQPLRLLIEMVKATRQLEMRSGASKLLTLLRHLATAAPTVPIALQLREWATMFEGTLADRGLLCQPVTLDPTPQHLTILVSLEPHRHTLDQYQIRVWSAINSDEYIPIDTEGIIGDTLQGQETTYSLERVPQFLSHLLNTRLRSDIRQVGRKNVRVELLIPFALFNTDLENLNVDVDDDFGGELLGKRYPMVVRSLDRLEAWAERWLVDWESHGSWFNQLASHQPIHPVAWFFTPTACAIHQDVCDTLDDHHGMVLAFPIQEVTDSPHYESLCRALLKRGIPIALWSRAAMADTTDIQATITTLLNHGDNLPFLLYQHRKAAGQDRSVYPITLLWDNPQHVPIL